MAEHTLYTIRSLCLGKFLMDISHNMKEKLDRHKVWNSLLHILGTNRQPIYIERKDIHNYHKCIHLFCNCQLGIVPDTDNYKSKT